MNETDPNGKDYFPTISAQTALEVGALLETGATIGRIADVLPLPSAIAKLLASFLVLAGSYGPPLVSAAIAAQKMAERAHAHVSVEGTVTIDIGTIKIWRFDTGLLPYGIVAFIPGTRKNRPPPTVPPGSVFAVYVTNPICGLGQLA